MSYSLSPKRFVYHSQLPIDYYRNSASSLCDMDIVSLFSHSGRRCDETSKIGITSSQGFETNRSIDVSLLTNKRQKREEKKMATTAASNMITYSCAFLHTRSFIFFLFSRTESHLQQLQCHCWECSRKESVILRNHKEEIEAFVQSHMCHFYFFFFTLFFSTLSIIIAKINSLCLNLGERTCISTLDFNFQFRTQIISFHFYLCTIVWFIWSVDFATAGFP